MNVENRMFNCRMLASFVLEQYNLAICCTLQRRTKKQVVFINGDWIKLAGVRREAYRHITARDSPIMHLSLLRVSHYVDCSVCRYSYYDKWNKPTNCQPALLPSSSCGLNGMVLGIHCRVTFPPLLLCAWNCDKDTIRMASALAGSTGIFNELHVFPKLQQFVIDWLIDWFSQSSAYTLIQAACCQCHE